MKDYKKVYYKFIPVNYRYTSSVIRKGIDKAKKIGVIEDDDFYPFSIEIGNFYSLLVVISFKKFSSSCSIIDYNECRPKIIRESITIINLDVSDDFLKNTNSIYLGKKKQSQEIIIAGAIIADLITKKYREKA